jgi:hypothetical protein
LMSRMKQDLLLCHAGARGIYTKLLSFNRKLAAHDFYDGRATDNKTNSDTYTIYQYSLFTRK